MNEAGIERASYTVEETARIIGMSRVATYEAIRRGDLPHIRINKRIIVPRTALERWLQNCGK